MLLYCREDVLSDSRESLCPLGECFELLDVQFLIWSCLKFLTKSIRHITDWCYTK